jgi:hypothetical protein
MKKKKRRINVSVCVRIFHPNTIFFCYCFCGQPIWEGGAVVVCEMREEKKIEKRKKERNKTKQNKTKQKNKTKKIKRKKKGKTHIIITSSFSYSSLITPLLSPKAISSPISPSSPFSLSNTSSILRRQSSGFSEDNLNRSITKSGEMPALLRM